MDNKRLKSRAAVFDDCFEVIRVNAETGRCDFLKRCAEHTLVKPTIDEYLAALGETGWILPNDHEVYSEYFALSRIKESVNGGRLILNSVRVKPADAYLWTDFELIRPKDSPYIFLCIKDLRRGSRPALDGFSLLMRTSVTGVSLYPIKAPLGEWEDIRASLEGCMESFDVDFSAVPGTECDESRSADGCALRLISDAEGVTAAVYEESAVSGERLEEVMSFCRSIDPKSGLLMGKYVKENAESSESGQRGIMLICAEGVSYNKAFMILKRDYAECAFAPSKGRLAVVLADEGSRLRYEFGVLCRRLMDTGGDFEIYTASSACAASTEELLTRAENSRPQTPWSFRWPAAEECRDIGDLDEKVGAYK